MIQQYDASISLFRAPRGGTAGVLMYLYRVRARRRSSKYTGIGIMCSTVKKQTSLLYPKCSSE